MTQAIHDAQQLLWSHGPGGGERERERDSTARMVSHCLKSLSPVTHAGLRVVGGFRARFRVTGIRGLTVAVIDWRMSQLHIHTHTLRMSQPCPPAGTTAAVNSQQCSYKHW